jgi:hypothetical protein
MALRPSDSGVCEATPVSITPASSRRAGVLLVGALAPLALVAAGCGGSTPPRVASVAATTVAQPSSGQAEMAQAVKWAACMRSHGLPGFPDPTAVPGGGVHFDVLPAMATSAADATASQSCEKLQPAPTPPSAAQLAPLVKHLLILATCMRQHDVRNFPDPTSDGAFHLSGLGITKNSPAVIAALKTCLPKAGLPSGAASALATTPP